MRAIFGQARADFLERSRRFSFLAMIALALFMAYWFVPGVSETSAIMEEMIAVEPDIFIQGGNASWIPVATAVGLALFLTAIGFLFLLGSVVFDEKIGVEQLITASPTCTLRYLFGKWLSGTLLLYCIAAAAIVGSFFMILWHFPGEWLSLYAFFSPYLYLLAILPLAAAFSLVFGVLRFLRGPVGIVVFFTLMIVMFEVTYFGSDSLIIRAFDASALSSYWTIIIRSASEVSGMDVQIVDIFGGYGQTTTVPPTLQLTFNGLRYNAGDFAVLGMMFLLSVMLTTISAPLYKLMMKLSGFKRKSAKPLDVPVENIKKREITPVFHAAHSSGRQMWILGIVAELKLMLKGRAIFWMPIAFLGFAANIILPFFLEMSLIYTYAVPILMLWFVSVFSQLGSREHQHDMLQIIAAIPGGKLRQILYSWSAGLLVSLTLVLPLVLHLLIDGQFAGVFAALAGAVFLPSLALFLGVLTKTSRVFEMILIVMTFMLVNGVTVSMYMGYPNIDSVYQATVYLVLGVIFGVSAIFMRQVKT